jgi:hypothetical protein
LRNDFPEALLLLVNAEYPNIVSQDEYELVSSIIRNLDLTDHVLLINDYLEDEQSALLLQSADVIVFPYQHTNESVSGAVRFGLVSGRPVVCTPLPIFSDLKDVVHMLPGMTPAAIAEGVTTILRDAAARDDVIKRQSAWSEDHSWGRLGDRLSGMLIGLHLDATGEGIEPPLGRGVPADVAGSALGEVDDLTTLPTRVFVHLVYQRLLNQSSEAPAYDDDVKAIESGDITREEFVDKIRGSALISDIERDLGSPESLFYRRIIKVTDFDQMEPAAFLTEMYRIFLTRDPDNLGKGHYLDCLQLGSKSRRDVIEEIMSSSEFQGLNRPILVI